MSSRPSMGTVIAGLSIVIGYFLIVCAAGLGVIWVAIHFIRKFW